MKILAVGDFHGKIPSFLKKIIKKEKPDVILSQGDYCAFYERKLWFKHCYAKETELWEVIGKKRARTYVKKDVAAGKKIYSYVSKLGLPFFSVTGNEDPSKYHQIGGKVSRWKLFKMKPFISRKSLLDFTTKKFKDYILIGYPRSSYPGLPTRHLKKKYKVKDFSKNIRDYKRYEKKLNKLFRKHKNKKIIFISHNCPYMTKLDKLSKKAHKLVRGKHYGDILAKETIKKHQPLLSICGHMHENQGKTKVGKTLVVNPGAAVDKKFAIIDIKGKKTKVKFYK